MYSKTLTSTPLANLRKVFTRWLGSDYDLDAIHAALAVSAAIRLDGDPAWLLLISGPGNAKTETVASLEKTGAHIISTIASTGALLSATSKSERADDSTGGLLRTIGDSGVLVLKDFTSILSLPNSSRPEVLAALREIYDGRWTRTVGVDGGRTLEWTGRIAVIGAVTTEWDKAHSTVSSMGDRFVLLRLDSTKGRLSGGRQAIANTGSEIQMRAELAQAAKAVMDAASTKGHELSDWQREQLLLAADLVTRARTAVSRDGQGNVTDAHAPEMPTRFSKQLAQIARGAIAIGMEEGEAMQLAIRCARDSVPPLRLAILEDLTTYGDSCVTDVRKRLGKPHATVDRELQALHMLGLVVLREEAYSTSQGTGKTRWHYSITSGINTAVLFSENYLPPQPQEGAYGSTSFSETVTAGGKLDFKSQLIARGKEVSDSLKHAPIK